MLVANIKIWKSLLNIREGSDYPVPWAADLTKCKHSKVSPSQQFNYLHVG